MPIWRGIWETPLWWWPAALITAKLFSFLWVQRAIKIKKVTDRILIPTYCVIKEIIFSPYSSNMVPRCVFRTNWVTMLSIRLLLQVPKRPWSLFWKLASEFNILIPPIHHDESTLNPFTMLFRQALWLCTIHGWSSVLEWCVPDINICELFWQLPLAERQMTQFSFTLQSNIFRLLKAKQLKQIEGSTCQSWLPASRAICKHVTWWPNKAVMLSLWLRFLTSPNVSQCQLIVHSKIIMLSSFTHAPVIPNQYCFLFSCSKFE